MDSIDSCPTRASTVVLSFTGGPALPRPVWLAIEPLGENRRSRRQADSMMEPTPHFTGDGRRHAGPFSVNKSPDQTLRGARFDSVDSCKQNPDRPHVAPTMNQLQPLVVRDSKDLTMSAVINRGGGRPSKGLRKYIGFRTPAKTAEDVHMIAAAKGMTVTDYVASAVDRSLREDLALLDQFTQQDELPIRMAS